MNDSLYNFFVSNYGRSRVALVGTSDWIGEAVRSGQRNLTPDGKPSLWSHVFIIGEMRPDRREPGNTTISPYIFESDIHVGIINAQVRNGAQENWIGKWCKDETEHAAIFDFDLNTSEEDAVLGTALQLCNEQVMYPIHELVGTWIALVTKREWQPNPFDDPRAMYCSSFVRYCYQKAGRDFLGSSVDVSNTTPEHIAQCRSFLVEWHR
jgi:hypothetical protein